MPPGRESKALEKRHVERLKEFQRAKRYSVPQLKLAMAAPFKYQTLQRALRGEPIWILNHAFIVDWLDRFVPERANGVEHDSKRAAAGDREEEIPQERARLRSE